jgi:hypothetical protein
VAEVASRTLVAAALFAGALAAQATPFADAMDAIKANDCRKLGDAVNEHLDSSAAVKYLAGAMYEEGICVDRDLGKAARYYAAADGAGDSGAARDMALQYLRGTNLRHSYARAGAWFAKSFHLAGSAPETKLPRSLPQLPASAISPDAEWAGYLVSVGFIGSVTTPYPNQALRDNVEGKFNATVCLASGTVETKAIRVEPGPSAGVRAVQGSATLQRALEQNFRSVLESMPAPKSPPPGPMCFEQPVDFKIRSR